MLCSPQTSSTTSLFPRHENIASEVPGHVICYYPCQQHMHNREASYLIECYLFGDQDCTFQLSSSLMLHLHSEDHSFEHIFLCDKAGAQLLAHCNCVQSLTQLQFLSATAMRYPLIWLLQLWVQLHLSASQQLQMQMMDFSHAQLQVELQIMGFRQAGPSSNTSANDSPWATTTATVITTAYNCLQLTNLIKSNNWQQLIPLYLMALLFDWHLYGRLILSPLNV